VATTADPKTVKPGDDTPIKPDDPVLKQKPQTDVAVAPVSTTGKLAGEEDAIPVGSHKGKDVFKPRVDRQNKPVVLSQAELQAGLAPLASRKNATVAIDNVSDNGASLRVKVRVDGVEVEVEVALRVSDNLPPAAHADDGGSARFTIDRQDGKWKATIDLASGLDPRDVRFVLGHEIDELSDIVGKHPAGSRKDISGEMVAGVTRDNNDGKKIHSHDVAAANEIIDLFNDWKRLVAEGSPDSERRKQSLDRAIAANNMGKLTKAKTELLDEVAAPDGLRAYLENPKAQAESARLSKSDYHGNEFSAVKLLERGVDVGVVTVENLGTKPVAQSAPDDLLNRAALQPKYHATESVPGESAVGKRSPTLKHLSDQIALDAFRQMATQAKGYKVIGAIDGQAMTIEVTLSDGSTKRQVVKLLDPTHLPDGQMAGSRVYGAEVQIWVSATLPDDQVHRAVGAIMGQVVDNLKRPAGAPKATTEETARASAVGQIDSLLGHLTNTQARNVASPVEALPKGGSIEDRAKVAQKNAKRESTDRIAAELELLLAQHGADQPGAKRDELFQQMGPDLARRAEEFLKGRKQIGFDASKTVDESAMPTAPVDEDTNRPSTVLAPAPKQPQPYNEADRVTVLELRVVFETIAEIDTRLAQRDQKDTGSRATPIAAGETLRRKEMVERAQALLGKLQLGGTDPDYYQARLKELETVFPGAADAITPHVTKRVNERVESDKAHAEAEAYQTRVKVKSEAIEQELLATAGKLKDPFLCDRIVVGDGATGLANVAGLGVKPDKDGFIDPKKILVVGGEDLIARMADADPNMRWGQRPEVFDGKDNKHPIFRGGDNDLHRTAEDPGDFSTVGQVSDAMDLARSRMGVARATAVVLRVELQESHGSDWPESASGHPVRVVMMVGGKEVVVYTKATDITTGIGTALLPDESILSKADRKKLLDDKNKVILSGEQAMTDADLDQQKVLVIGYGPTGAWAAIEAARRGATNVDWGGSSSQLSEHHSKANEQGFAALRGIDRVQEALDPRAKINITSDRIGKIEAQGKGALVTYITGTPPAVQTYQVFYDRLISAAMPTPAKDGNTVASEQPNAGTIVDGVPLAPQAGTKAPVWASKGDLVRVMGPAAEGVTSDDKDVNKDMKGRREAIPRTADSPDHRVMEATGTAVDMANGVDTGTK